MKYANNSHIPRPINPRRTYIKYIIGVLFILAFIGGGFYIATHTDQLLALMHTGWFQLKTWWFTTGWDTLKYPLGGLAAIGIVILLIIDR